MTVRPLNIPVTTVGHWFIPENPSRSVSGTLAYDGQLSVLNLTDSLEPLLVGKVTAGYAKGYRVVHGATRDLGKVSLFDAAQMGLAFNISQEQMAQQERLRATTLIIGRHVDPDTMIRRMDFRIPGLEIWLSRQVIWNEITPPTANSPALQIVHVVTPTPEIIAVPSIDGTVSFTINVPMSISNEVTRFSIAATGTLTITSKTGQNLAWFLEQYGYVEALIALLAGCPMPVDQIQARFNDEQTAYDVLLALPKIPHCTATSVNDFFVFRGLLGAQFQGLIQRWFAEKSKLQLSVGLAANILASQDLWTHLEFLSLLQALEGFHRATFDGTYMADADYDKVKKALGDAIPSTLTGAHKSSLKSRIRYGNEYSLQKRLNELVAWLPDPVHLLAIGAAGDFPRPWIDTRNFFTHWDKELEKKVVTGQALYEANVRLGVLLRVVYLHSVGVDAQILEKALNGTNPLAQHLIQLNFPDSAIMEIRPAPEPISPDAPSSEPTAPTQTIPAGDKTGAPPAPDVKTDATATAPADLKKAPPADVEPSTASAARTDTPSAAK